MTDHDHGSSDRRAGFSEDTAVEPVGDGSFRGGLTDRWHVLSGAAPNGGYVAAVAARAMAKAAGRPDPVTLTAHFLRPPAVGPCDIHVEVVKTGKRFVTASASLLQEHGECVRLIGAFADLTALDGPTRVDRDPPELPPIDECLDLGVLAEAGEDRVPLPPIARRFDHRVPQEVVGWAVGQPFGRGEMRGHVRFAGGEPMDTLGLLVLADAYPPAVFNMGLDVGWVPTVELTVQVRKRPAPGWLRARMTTTAVTKGLLEEDGEVWDADGDLVVLSRQLALAARPTS